MKLTDMPLDFRRDTSPDTDMTPVAHTDRRTVDPVHAIEARHAGCDRCRNNPRPGFSPSRTVLMDNDLASVNGTICSCLVIERLRALRRSLGLPKCNPTRNALRTRLRDRLIIRGGEWSTVSEHISAAVVHLTHPALKSMAREFAYPRVHISDLYEVVATSVLMGKAGMPPSDLLVIRLNMGYAKHAGNAPALAEVMYRCRNQPVWLVDEPRERLGPGDPRAKIPPHRAWSDDVGHLIDELGYVEVKDIDQRVPIDLTHLPRLPSRPASPRGPLTEKLPPRPATIKPDNAAEDPDAPDASDMLAGV